MVVWAVTIPLFWYVTLHNLQTAKPLLPRRLANPVGTARRFHGVILTGWFLLIAIAVLEEFWLYWSTLLA